MASQFNWDKPVITVDDITRILVQQYGPEQPTRILVEDTGKPIQYKSALVSCECLRCGRTFMMTPFALVNSIYLNGYVCTKCGMLSDDELGEMKQEERRVQALEVLKKKNNHDIVKETAELEKSKEKDNTENKSEESISAENEFEYDYSDDSEFVSEGQKNDSSEEIQETTKEDDNLEDKYMASDEDYNVSTEEMVEDNSSVQDEIEDKEDLTDEQKEEIMDAVGSTIFGSEETEQEENTDEDEFVVVDDDELKNIEPKEEELPSEIIGEVSDDDVFGVEEPEDEPVKEDKNLIWVGQDAYTEDELVDALRQSATHIKEKLGYIPFDLNNCNVTDDGKLEIKCKDCRNVVTFESFKAMEDITDLNSLKEIYLLDLDDGRTNGANDENPKITSCSVCKESIVRNGYNKYYMNKISHIISPHGKLVNTNNYRFIDDGKAEFDVECNGVVKTLSSKDIFSIFGKDKDPTKNPIFERPKVEKIKINVNRSSNEEVVKEKVKIYTRDIEQSKADRSVESVEPESIKANLKIDSDFVSVKSSNETPKKSSVFTFVDQNESDNKEKIHVLNSKPVDYEAHAESNKSVFESNNRFTKNGRFKDDGLKSFEEERKYSEDQLKKHNVFSENPSMKIAKKSIARLSGKINPFERETSLKTEFNETCFASFIEDLSEKTGVNYNLIIDERSYEIPVVDFESGLRIICSNLEEADLVNARYEWIKPRVPFSYYERYAEDDGNGVLKKKRKDYIWCVLFSDSVEYARDATFAALVKYINPKILAYEGKKIVLQDNLMFQYTKNKQYLKDFDKRYSVFPSQKPSTGAIGIVARWETSNKATAKDVLKLKLQMEGRNNNVNNLDTLANDYDEYMVASIKYIEHYNAESGRVIYTITEYVEVGSSIIGDGLAQCLRALLKEYMVRYPQLRGIPPYVIVELDPNIYPSPSVRSYIERGTLCKMDDTFKNIIDGVHTQKKISYRSMKYSYVRRPEYRDNSSSLDHMRQDIRMFSAGTIIHRMANEIKQAGIANTIRNEEVKNTFIANMGYVEATQAEIKMYFVNQSLLFSLMSDGATYNLLEHIDSDVANAAKMVSNSNMGNGVNNVFMNPGAMNKYMNIMRNGSPEAKDYLNKLMADDYRQRMMDMQMNANQANTGNVFGMINPNQFGMNPMMGR